jgi:peptide/nickel transport system permease protein
VGSYIVRRILISIPVLLGITVLVFVFVALTPGDAASAYSRPELRLDPQALAAVRHRFGLDQPLPIRYVSWLLNTLQGNLGYSTVTGQPIVDTVYQALIASTILVGTAIVAGLFIGVPLGILSATRQYSRLDFLLTGVTFLGISIPSFLLGLGGLWIFGVTLKIVPIGGMSTPGRPTDFFDFLRHLFLPAAILGFGYTALFMRYTRASMLEVIHSDYITTANSKGLVPRTVIARHAFRNALIPIITILALSIPEIVGSAVVTEQVFSWPGVGNVMVRSIGARDYYAIMGVALVVAVAVLLFNLIADVAYAYVDPRIRYS